MKSVHRSVPRRLAALAGAVCFLGTIVSAQAQPPATGAKPREAQAPVKSTSRLDVRRPPGVRLSRPAGSGEIGSRRTSIQGAAWHSDNKPIPKALLRLRNVVTGKIEATTMANEAGNFAFNGIPDGTYVIEMVSEGGKLMMVGHMLTVAPGETVATFLRLGPKVPWFNGFFGNAAQTVSSSAATTGVTAVAPDVVTPVSAKQ